eukprot:Gb_07508 [translate_table: standard]
MVVWGGIQDACICILQEGKNTGLGVYGSGYCWTKRLSKTVFPSSLNEKWELDFFHKLISKNKLQLRLRDEGGIKSLLGMVRSRHTDVLAQVARGVANFAKCESRGATQGHRKGRSLLIDDGALPWIVANSNSEAAPIRRHIELALCHLAQHDFEYLAFSYLARGPLFCHMALAYVPGSFVYGFLQFIYRCSGMSEANARDLVACGALWELVRISRECSREDIRNLAKQWVNHDKREFHSKGLQYQRSNDGLLENWKAINAIRSLISLISDLYWSGNVFVSKDN